MDDQWMEVYEWIAAFQIFTRRRLGSAREQYVWVRGYQRSPREAFGKEWNEVCQASQKPIILPNIMFGDTNAILEPFMQSQDIRRINISTCWMLDAVQTPPVVFRFLKVNLSGLRPHAVLTSVNSGLILRYPHPHTFMTVSYGRLPSRDKEFWGTGNTWA